MAHLIMTRSITVGDRTVGSDSPVYIIAEMSGNHGQDFNEAVRILRAAKSAGADAIKLQTYRADTLTIDSSAEAFNITGTPWSGRTLFELYSEAYTPWEWHPKLQSIALELGLDFFSTPFDSSAVDFLETLEVPMYKIASFENVDLELLRKVAATRKPIIMSTGMATLGEIEEAVTTLREAGGGQVALLKCTSAYPAPPEEMNLRTIPHLADAFDVPVGLSDHSLEIAVPVTATALGACIVEKHLVLSRSNGGPDSAFSLEPGEFSAMVKAIRITERALGKVQYQVGVREAQSRVFRRSLFVVTDVKAGEVLTAASVKSIRPGNGLAPRHYNEVIGRRATRDIKRGTPLSWDLVGGKEL